MYHKGLSKQRWAEMFTGGAAENGSLSDEETLQQGSKVEGSLGHSSMEPQEAWFKWRGNITAHFLFSQSGKVQFYWHH